MNSLLYTIAVILVICWAIGFFFTAIGSIIHILLVIALIIFLLKIIRRPTAV
ncbi:lmo0937 family membrane protein [Mucilaginibacter sp. MD40]|uniref:lmo0937 family membrane protein n=1 Tax=Mucilaginibacter sp. MD40 TaxID=2029590 RepID=UPI00117E47C5|nr:lmo0937 family membrane protein [Mucilaginibacter sp. MD40]